MAHRMFLKDSWGTFVSYFVHHVKVLQDIGIEYGQHLSNKRDVQCEYNFYSKKLNANHQVNFTKLNFNNNITYITFTKF